MSNPTISFRMSKFHLARALNIIRQFEPNYQITSASHIVKTCFFDYISKMNLNRSAEVPNNIIIELEDALENKGQATLSLDDIINIGSQDISIEQAEKSTITAVSDFSPPDDWKEEKEE